MPGFLVLKMTGAHRRAVAAIVSERRPSSTEECLVQESTVLVVVLRPIEIRAVSDTNAGM